MQLLYVFHPKRTDNKMQSRCPDLSVISEQTYTNANCHWVIALTKKDTHVALCTGYSTVVLFLFSLLLIWPIYQITASL